jgi:hypothetical protein
LALDRKDCEFVFPGHPVAGHTGRHHSCLRVQINRSVGLGVLTWHVGTHGLATGDSLGGIYDYVWISDNPEPPDFDPDVVADDHCGYFHDPASALPLEEVWNSLREFCRLATGDRPASHAWVQGDLQGQRFDRPLRIEEVEDDEGGPWAAAPW